MLTLADIAKSHGSRLLFEEVSLFIARSDRLGLVGPNGAGKTTLFRLILGEESADGGTITIERGVKIGHLPQEGIPAGDETVLQIACGHARRLAGPDADGHEDYTLEPRARRILAGLGFREGTWDRPARTFSGGWVMRAHLAGLLVAQPDLLLLDEPTNHLDLEALLWFQNHLAHRDSGLVIISHDRSFLNALCTGILELSGGAVERYTGNYDAYLAQREARHEQQLALWKNQQREIAHLQRFVDRFGAKATLASRAKSKEKQIARLMEEAVEEPERDLKRIHFRFPQPPRSGLKVMRLENVRQAYGEHVVYRGDLTLTLERGRRIVLVGPNGAGKSTLLKILAGVVPIQGGTCEAGHNVTVGYFAQNRTDTLRTDGAVLDNIMELRTAENGLTEQQARTLLGAFLFRKDDVFKPVTVLSGGEKSRLALARILIAPPNLLLMDEPTTHLDISSIDALIHAVTQYEGTLVFISHDVHFIRAVADEVWHVSDGRVTPYAGGYDYFLDKSGQADGRGAIESGAPEAGGDVEGEGAAAAAPTGGPKTRGQRRLEAEARAVRREKQKRVEALEAEVVGLEERQAALVRQLEQPETHADNAKVFALNRELADLIDRLEAATAAWESAALELQDGTSDE